MNRRLTRAGNRFAVWLYRRFDGRPFGIGRKEVGVVLLTVPGRRSGLPRSTCVRFLQRGEDLVVWGTGSGARQDPDWFRNLRAARVAEVQVGGQHWQVSPHELQGDERAAVWSGVILAQAPEVLKYARRAEREIPVAVLVRREPGR